MFFFPSYPSPDFGHDTRASPTTGSDADRIFRLGWSQKRGGLVACFDTIVLNLWRNRFSLSPRCLVFQLTILAPLNFRHIWVSVPMHFVGIAT
jgi:hypothetical protein